MGCTPCATWRPGEQGLHLIEAGDAEVVFEVFTPYIIVAKINDLDNPADDAEASVVTLEAALPVTLAVSLDHGLTWKPVETVPSGKKAVDLTNLVKGTYGYLLRLSASGAEKQTAIKSLSIDTWVQVAPISLPRLKKGENHLQYEVGDRYGLQTIPMLVSPDTSNPKDLEKYVVAMPQDYDPQRHTSRIVGETHPASGGPRRNEDRVAQRRGDVPDPSGRAGRRRRTTGSPTPSAQPRDFKEIYRSAVPTWVSHWRYNWDTDIRLDQPAEVVYVKFHGDPGLNTMRACLHLLPKDPPSTGVRITHTYDIDGRRYEKTVDLAEPAAYTISCDGDPENVSVTIAAPSK